MSGEDAPNYGVECQQMGYGACLDESGTLGMKQLYMASIASTRCILRAGQSVSFTSMHAFISST